VKGKLVAAAMLAASQAQGHSKSVDGTTATVLTGLEGTPADVQLSPTRRGGESDTCSRFAFPGAGGIIDMLPEGRSARETFGSHDLGAGRSIRR